MIGCESYVPAFLLCGESSTRLHTGKDERFCTVLSSSTPINHAFSHDIYSPPVNPSFPALLPSQHISLLFPFLPRSPFPPLSRSPSPPIFPPFPCSSLSKPIALFLFPLFLPTPPPPPPPHLLSSLPSYLSQDRSLFSRETFSRAYRSSTYMLATSAAYLPLQALQATAVLLEVWWCVGMAGGASGAGFFWLICFASLFTGNAIASVCSSVFTK